MSATIYERTHLMLGAIAGDIIGSPYEANGIKTTDFPLLSEASRFTDDTVLTVAVADCILNGSGYADKFKEYYNRYPNAGYGAGFMTWAASSCKEPYNSFGNGSAMRVSPVGFAYDSFDEVIEQARKSAEVTHNHPEGIKGAQATAAAVHLARMGESKAVIKQRIAREFGYALDESLESIRPAYSFDSSCQGSVPQAITVFLESEDYEDAIRKAVSLGGDSDTLACIAGGIAQAYYKEIPDPIQDKVYQLLDSRLRRVVTLFNNTYNCL